MKSSAGNRRGSVAVGCIALRPRAPPRCWLGRRAEAESRTQPVLRRAKPADQLVNRAAGKPRGRQGEVSDMTRSIGILCAVLLAASAFADPNPERDAFFGETHVHTSWSLDAFAIGNMTTTPGDAYKYFQGEPIKHPLGYDVKIDTPLDWAGVTDHSEYAGVVNLANEPGSAVSKIPEAEPLILK